MSEECNGENKTTEYRNESAFLSHPKLEEVHLPNKARYLPVLNTLARTAEASSQKLSRSSKTSARTHREERCDATQNRERVLIAARTLFAERGIEGVTMSEIAEFAGVGKGTLYRRFAHKGVLCQALMDANTRAFQEEVLGGFGEEGQRATPLGRLRLFLNRLLDFTEKNAAFLQASFEAEVEQGGTSFYSQPSYDWVRMTSRNLLADAVASGECRPGLDLEYLADAVLAPLQVGLYLHQRRVRGFSPERIGNGIEQLLEGILVQVG